MHHAHTGCHCLSSQPGLLASFLGWADECHPWNARSVLFPKYLEEPSLLPPGMGGSTVGDIGRSPAPESAFKVAALPGTRTRFSQSLPKTFNSLSAALYRRTKMEEGWFIKGWKIRFWRCKPRKRGTFRKDEGLNSRQILFKNFTFSITNTEEETHIDLTLC